MQKRLVTLILLIILTFNLNSSEGFQKNDFESGLSDVMCYLDSSENCSILNLTIPAECYILNASMKVCGFPIEDNITHFPNNPQIKFNESTLWEYNGSGYGFFGMQNTFFNASTINYEFGQGGGINHSKVILPKNAVIQNASMIVDCRSAGNISMIGDLNINGSGSDFGGSVANAGDVNRDGYSDLVIGGCDNAWIGGISANNAFIYLGSSNNINQSTPIVLQGNNTTTYYRWIVSGAVDINNDGYDDIIASPRYAFENGSYSVSARAYIYLGGPNITGIPDVVLTWSNHSNDLFWSVSAGDFNHDGYSDVIIGSPFDESGKGGNVLIFFGGNKMNTTPDVIIKHPVQTLHYGWALSTLGDINGDNIDDFIVLDENIDDGVNGTAYIYLGGSIINTSPYMVIRDDSKRTYYGSPVTGPIDYNHDGYDDIVIGTYLNKSSGNSTGRVYIYYGGKTIDNVPDIILNGHRNGEGFGFSVSSIGDINRDTYDDLLVGAPGNSQFPLRGIAYLYYGGVDNSFDVLSPYSDDSIVDLFASSVAGAGDLNNDGNMEIIIGAYANYNIDTFGRAFVYSIFPDNMNPELKIENVSFYSSTGFSNYRRSINNFSKLFDSDLLKVENNYVDLFGNIMAEIDLNIFSQGPGIITLSSLNIRYVYNASVPDFSNILNEYIQYQKILSGLTDNLTIPFHVEAENQCYMRIFSLNITIDNAPTLSKLIPDCEIFENTIVNNILDLSNYFNDDYDTINNLTYEISDAINDNIINITILDNRYLSVDALTGSETDNWTGEALLKIVAIDKHNSKMVSNPFRIFVQHKNNTPIIISSPPTNVTVGNEYIYSVVANDLDGDILTYRIINGPNGMAIDNTTGKLLWVPNESNVGTINVSIMVSDNLSGDTLQTFSVNIYPKQIIKPVCTINYPVTNTTVSGIITIKGNAICGTSEIIKIDIRINNGEWIRAIGINNWSYRLDTLKLNNGKNRVEIVAVDKDSISDSVLEQFNVLNTDQKDSLGSSFLGVTIIILIAMSLIIIYKFKQSIKSSNKKERTTKQKSRHSLKRRKGN